MEEAVVIFGLMLALGWNALLLYWSRGYLRYAAVAMFALNLVIGSPLFGVVAWNLASQDVDTNYVEGYGDVLVAVIVALANGVAALVGAVVAALRKPPAAAANDARENRRDPRR